MRQLFLSTHVGRAARFGVGALVLLAIVALGVGPVAAQPKEKKAVPIKFRLTWLPGGIYLNFFTAVNKGFYKAEGLDVTIEPSANPQDSIKLIASGENPLGVTYGPDFVFAGEQGLPLTIVYAVSRRHDMGIIVTKESGIKAPKDFEGKTIGVTLIPMDRAMFTNMVKTAKVDEGKVKVINPGFAGVGQVLEGKLDGTSELDWYGGAIFRVKKRDYTLVRYGDYGAPEFPFYVVAVNNDWLKKNEDAVRRFIRATNKGYKYAKEKVDESLDLVMKQYPNLDRAVERQIWVEFAKIMEDSDTAKNGLGHLDPKVWRTAADFLIKAGVVKSAGNLDTLLTNKYLEKPAK